MGLLKMFSRDKKQVDKAELSENLDQGLKKTRESFLGKITRAVVGKSRVGSDFLDELEEILISSDVAVDTTVKIIERLEKRVAREKYFNTDELLRLLHDEVQGLLSENKTSDQDGFVLPEVEGRPYVIMVVGVNGVGKTTTIGKLAFQLKSNGKNVILGAADTFRAAAVQQLKIWGERVGVPVVEKGMQTDPSAVAYDAVQKGFTDKADVVIIDTAGRLHNKVNLMNELSKIRRVMTKVVPDVPDEVLLVLDASTGQNALEQAKEFTKATQVTGLVLTKLDGTAKGGVVLSIAEQFGIPIKYIGVGEKMEHLQVFDRVAFVDSLFGDSLKHA